MATSAEDLTFPVIEIGGLEFQIGAATLYQFFLAKNFVVSLVRSTRRNFVERKRNYEARAAAEFSANEETIRVGIADRLQIKPEDVPEMEMLTATKAWIDSYMELEETADDVNSMTGTILDFVGALSEEQMAELFRLLLARNKKTTMHRQWIEQHFNLPQFLEVITLFLEYNSLGSIIKNFQRLGTVLSTQIRTQPLTTD